MSNEILLPSKPRLVKDDGNKGIYEIDGLYPGYGHTLGNSLRRIILSSLPGAAITTIKIDGVSHEFETLAGVREDVINIILNLKRVRFKMLTDEPQTVTLLKKGDGVVTAGDIDAPGQVEVLNADQYICEVVDKKKELSIELTIQKGLGFVSKEMTQKEKMEIGAIALDAIFTPIRRVSYEVENMRVGDRTDHNRLRLSVETDGTYSPREAIEKSIEIMIMQLQSIHDFKGLDERKEMLIREVEEIKAESNEEAMKFELSDDKRTNEEELEEAMKTRIEDLNLSTRTLNSLNIAKIRTVGGIARKTKDDLMNLEGIGEKGVQEIKRALSNFGIILK
jgi:DNA-directed RNA polymerase subunit alpha